MAEYTPFQQSFVGNLEIEDYKRHLTMPDDPCSTCYYYPDYYSECQACGAAGKPTIELTGFEFDDIAFTGPNKRISWLGTFAPSYPFTYPVERNGIKYPKASTIAECRVRLDDCAQYTGYFPWPVPMSTLRGANCAGQSGYFDVPSARAAWGDYIGVSCGEISHPCWGCQALPGTYIDPPEATYDVSIFACYNIHYATSYRPGCLRGISSASDVSSYCSGDDQWQPIFTLPPGLLVYVSAISRSNSCFRWHDFNSWTSSIHMCFRVYHMELTSKNQFGNDLEVTRPLPNHYGNRTGYHLNCNRSGELNLIYESTNDYQYSNRRKNASHISTGSAGFSPSCIGSYIKHQRWGNWNGGDGKVTVNSNTALVIPARPKAGVSASASGTASVG